MLACATLLNQHGTTSELLRNGAGQSEFLQKLEILATMQSGWQSSKSDNCDLIPRLLAFGRSSGTTSLAQLEDIYFRPQSFVSIKLLGSGGFSTVDEVLHKATNLRISRKTLKNRQQSAVEELEKEVAVLQKLRHPHIIRFLGAYAIGEKLSILLSPVADTTLAIWLDRCHHNQPAGLADTVNTMFGCLTSSVRYLHEQRPVIKHMDIKPQNILVLQSSSKVPHVVLSDFGISSVDQASTNHQSQPLTRRYCAPEVPSGAARERAADIWSLGCVFLEMLMAASGQDNPDWLILRKEFSGRHGKYYWQEVSYLQETLAGFLSGARTPAEATKLLAVKSMLDANPDHRPTAAFIATVFTPASCCLSWPNEKSSYLGPDEELTALDLLLQDEGHGDVTSGKTRALSKHDTTEQALAPFARAKAWLQECCDGHTSCRRETDDTDVLPTRLIDIQPNDCQDGSWVQLVNTATVGASTDGLQYAALSYCWDDLESTSTMTATRLEETNGKVLRDAIPTNIQRAISTARDMGLRYIWIDSLCILQDSANDKAHEIANMASTYRNALLCMVLLSENDGSTTQRLEHTSSKWFNRVWTLQESLLSQRLLFLTGKQMYWECNALKASEALPHGLPSLLWEKIHNTTEITKRSPTKRRSKEPSTLGNHAQITHVDPLDSIKQMPFQCGEGCKSSRGTPPNPTRSAVPALQHSAICFSERNEISSSNWLSSAMQQTYQHKQD